MSSLIKIGIKDKNGKYQNYIISIQDGVDNYGNNVSMYVEQSKEEREQKSKRTYVGNGRVIWSSDNKIEVAPNPNAPGSQNANVEQPIHSTSSVLNDLKEEPSPSDYKTSANEETDDLPF